MSRKDSECDKIWAREFYRTHRESELLRTRDYRKRLKIKALTHYGGGKCACVVCGESREICLTIDHIEGGGGAARRANGLVGTRLYRWLIKQNYPPGYQTLCMNCQFVKREENDEYHLPDGSMKMRMDYQPIVESTRITTNPLVLGVGREWNANVL